VRLLVRAAVVGVAATTVMDLGGEIVRRTTGLATLDCRMLGRWIGHLRRGRVGSWGPVTVGAEPNLGSGEAPGPGW
jgi:hypothetical protein